MAAELVGGAWLKPVVSEFLKASITEVKLALQHKKLSRDLSLKLQDVDLFLDQLNCSIDSGNNEFVQRWLEGLRLRLNEAKYLTAEYENASVTRRIFMPRKILEVLNQMEAMIQDHGLVNISQNEAMLNKKEGGRAMFPFQCKHNQQFEGSSSTRAHYEGTKFHRVPENLFGVEQMVMKLELALLKEDSKWIGLWGKGGAGKTLISQLANNNDNVQAHFEGCIYWLTVGRNPVIDDLLRILLIQMHCPGVSGFEQQLVARNIVYNHCRDRKVLLILDDVWVRAVESGAGAGVLEQLDVVDASNGSKILVTTRNREMFDRLRPCTLLEVDMLSPENSWDLFRSHAFPDGESRLEPQVVEVAREVAAECKGLPLLLKVIGWTMAGKLHLKQWKDTLKNLKEARVAIGEHTEVILKLKLSYDDLLSVDKEKGKKLQTAFLYFAASESEVSAQWRFRLWRGEGLIVSSEDDDECHDEDYYDQAGYDILEELEKRSLIERVSDWYYIHDVLRSMAIYILEHQHGTCLFKAGQGLTGIPDKWHVDSGLINVERVSLADNKLEELSRPLKAPMLKVLLLNNNYKLARIRSVFLSEFKNLRVLDLSCTGIVTLPKAVSKLVNLVVLDLSNCDSLTTIPKGIGKLVNLVVLDLSHCGSLTTIPKGIGKLVKLEYLKMDWCIELESFPFDQLANLVQLRYLNMFYSCSRKQLVSRKQVVESLLRTLKINCHHFLAAFSSFRMEKLRHLTLENQTTELNCCDGLPTSLSNLETLECIDLRRFPRNMEKLKALTTLDLRWTWKAVGKLNTDVDSLPEEWGEPDAFPCLTRLHLSWCDSLERFPVLQHGAMRRLSELKCRGNHLMRVPESINVLTSLKRLDFGQCSNVKEIPDTLLSLDNLEDLILDHTGITTLPAGIARLPRLKELVLHNCEHLEMLPAEWEDGEDLFPRLERVCLSSSGVRKLPRGIATAPELQMIDVTDCKQELYEPELLSVLENRKRVRICGWPNTTNVMAAAAWPGCGCYLT